MDKLLLVIGGLLFVMGAVVLIGKAPILVRRFRDGAPTPVELHSAEASTQRVSGAALVILGATIVVDAVKLTSLALSPLGWAALFCASSIETRMDVRRLEAAGVASTHGKLKRKKLWANLGWVIAVLCLVDFVAEIVMPGSL